ncbi:hypothetical protein D1007_43417 [Hordeum vulgare]|nr:hypothetical protein D1007_43417 [Hordeum vulgare]
MRDREVSLAKESLASCEAKLHEVIDKGVAEAQRSLLLNYRSKLRLQESRFLARCCHLQNKVNALRRRLDHESLERRVSRALSDICGESPSAPLVPDDAGYLGFFLRVMERLEAGSTKALALTEEKTRDLLSQAASDVFSHLLRLNQDFNLAEVLDLVPETVHAALAEWVEVQVEDLVARLAPEGHDMDSGDDASP